MEIGLGTDSTMWNSRYQVLSGTDFPSVMYLPSDSAWIKFETDYNDTFGGFNLKIEQALGKKKIEINLDVLSTFS